jgi:chaperonin GroEL
MDYKEVRFGEESRTKLLTGINTISNAVRTTLGPKGRNVIIQQPFKAPHVTKDGVTVAKQVLLKDPLENTGALMVYEAAANTANKAGDGTTTATVLTQAIVTEGMKLVSAGMNPMDLKRGIDKAVDAVVEQLEKNAEKCAGPDEIRKVAAISANADSSIGETIADALEQVGKEGAISIETGKNLTDELEVVSGLQIQRGYMSAYFSTNHEALKTVLEDAYVFLYDKKITDIADLVELLDTVSKTRRPLLLVAEDIEEIPLQTLLMNHQNGSLKCCAVPAPGFADRRLPIMEDIGILTGGQVFSKELNRDLDTATIDQLGECERIEVDALTCTFIGGRGDPDKIEERVKHIRHQLETASNEYNADKLRNRLAKLNGGVAIIKVGGATEIEINEKKDRYDDALNATRAAIGDGIVSGGGVALLRAKQAIKEVETANVDQAAGVNIVLKAIESPLRQITQNAGESPDVVINEILNHSGNYGYNAATGEYGDMMQFGIIDPVKVTKTALLNAASIAGLLITSECSITVEKPLDQRDKPFDPNDIHTPPMTDF